MNQKTFFYFAFHLVCLFTPPSLRAESWPTLEKFVSDCVLIVKARQVGPFHARESFTFEVTETWRGRFDPREFTRTSPEGYILANQGELGARVTAGQEVVFFFTRDNQPEGKLSRHSAAFPIVDGKLVYGFTSDSPHIRRVFDTADFKRAIEAISVEEEEAAEIRKE